MIRLLLVLSVIMTGFFLSALEPAEGTIDQANHNLCKNFKCNEPVVIDPNLKVELIYQGNFSAGINEMSPVTTMTFLGQDIYFLNKNNGTVYKIRNGSQLADGPLLDVNVANERERGLLGIETVKGENNTKYFFLYYTESEQSDDRDVCPRSVYCEPQTNPIGNRLYRYELRGDKLVNPKLLLDLPATPGPSHNGGVLKIGPDNNLYMTVGDLAGSVNKSSSTKAQNFRNGTEPDGRAAILRMTLDGKPVSKNGLLGNEFPLNLYYAYGIRNSFGIDFDPITGNLWDSENGPEYADEINLVKPGFNSGWVRIQGIWRSHFDPSIKGYVAGEVSNNPPDLVDFGKKGTYSAPEFIWNNTIGPTALKFFNSDKLGKEYENDLFVGSDSIGTIFHFDLNGARTELQLDGVLKDKIANNNEELDDIIFAQGFGLITDIEIGPDGYLYILSKYQNKPAIFRISPNVEP